MALLLRALTNPDGTTPPDPDIRYIVSGTGSSAYFRFPEQAWDTIAIGVNEISIPDRDFANADAEPGRSQLAEFVDKGFVSVADDTINGTNAAFAFAAGIVTITAGVGTFTPSMVGQPITIAGATSPGNNGAFIIATYIGPASVTYANPAGVTEAGAGTWVATDVLTGDEIRTYV